jgi:hypothetical protein
VMNSHSSHLDRRCSPHGDTAAAARELLATSRPSWPKSGRKRASPWPRLNADARRSIGRVDLCDDGWRPDERPHEHTCIQVHLSGEEARSRDRTRADLRWSRALKFRDPTSSPRACDKEASRWIGGASRQTFQRQGSSNRSRVILGPGSAGN